MTTSITTLRATLATALTNTSNWSVFSYPPVSPIANSVIVQPDDPYIEPTNNQPNTVGPTANFKITMVVPMFDNQGNLGDIETFMVAVFNKLATSSLSVRVQSISAPTVLGVDAGQMLSADISISIITDWS